MIDVIATNIPGMHSVQESLNPKYPDDDHIAFWSQEGYRGELLGDTVYISYIDLGTDKSFLPFDDEEHERIHELGSLVDVFVLQIEIHEGPNGEPVRRNFLSHYTLGHMDTEGDFLPVYTILDIDHPVRILSKT